MVVTAWFGLGVRQAIDTSRATAIVDRGAPASGAEVRRVSSLVRAARSLNPDRQLDVILGQVEVEHGDYARARRLLRQVTRREPQNLDAWVWLGHASAGDPAGLADALAHVRQLDPRLQLG